MSLPDHSIPWPPPETEAPRRLYDTWGAWYSGDPAQLTRAYQGAQPGPRPQVRPSQYSGGVVGSVARWFWGSPPTEGEDPVRVHAPLAGDISATSADMLFGRQPLFHCEQEATQTRLDAILDDGGAYNALLEAAELCSAYGGVYLRATWDREVAHVPIWDAVAPDTAVPEWSHRRLRAVTFWRVVAQDKDTVWRHLERHETGRVMHGLYRGTPTMLGRPMPLADHPATAVFADHVDDQGAIPTGAEVLAARYVPNIRPHRLIRGSALGRSDYAGIEAMMDAYDATWSSWMRDLDIGRGRIMVPDEYLDDQGPGQGARFDPHRQVFVGLDIPSGMDSGASISAQQFDIRTEEHSRTARELLAVILRSAGYSLSTFGLQDEGEGAQQTATEVSAKRERTQATTARKREYWRPELAALAQVMLSIDAQILGNRITPERPAVEWPETTGDPRTVAETTAMLTQAEAASTKTKVRMLHPDWDSDEVDTEVQTILAETGRSVPDPAGDFGAESAHRPPGAF